MWSGDRLKIFIEFKALHEGVPNSLIRSEILDLLKITKQEVSQYTGSRSCPKFQGLEKLADYFNLRIDDFSDRCALNKEEIYARIQKSKKNKTAGKENHEKKKRKPG